MKDSPPGLRCPVCSSLLERDGVCLACFFKVATEASLEGEDRASSRGDRPSFAAIGKITLPCEFARHRLVRELGSGGTHATRDTPDQVMLHGNNHTGAVNNNSVTGLLPMGNLFFRLKQ